MKSEVRARSGNHGAPDLHVTLNHGLSAPRPPDVDGTAPDNISPTTGWAARPPTAKTRLQCPCGEFLQGEDEDDLVDKAQQHLRERHRDLEYDREDILFMAY